MSTESFWDDIEGKKEKGNEYVKKAADKSCKLGAREAFYSEAEREYNGVLELLDSLDITDSTDTSEKEKLTKFKLTVLSNRATVRFNLNRYIESLGDCDILLSLDPNHAKGMFRKASHLYVHIHAYIV